jgi:integrase
MELHYHLHYDVHIHPYGEENADAHEKISLFGRQLLYDVLEKQIRQMESIKSASTIDNYTTALRSLVLYTGREMAFADFNAMTLQGYERWLRSRNICLNTISCYMRSLRALFRQTGIPHVEDDFKTVFTGSTRTRKRSIPVEAIIRLRQLSLPEGSFIALARDVFLFSFYAMGMPFVDVAHLRHAQLTQGTIVYNRQKTGQQVAIAVEPALQTLMDKYRSPQSDYVFPQLYTKTPHEYQILLGHYNRALHRLRHLAGIEAPLTSYVVRHTWASTAFRSNVELNVISKALGHTNPQTTLTYIREIDDNQLAQANKKIISTVAEL